MAEKANEEAEEKEEMKEETVTVTEKEWNDLQKEKEEYKSKYLHLLADNENARKRLQKERQEISSYAIENTVLSFLQPIDNFENALKYAESTSDEVKNWAIGFEMILNQFKNALSDNGIKEFSAIGEKFNPHDHEAVEMCETEEHQSGIIVDEFHKGYKMGQRTIRPSKVKVAKKPNKQENKAEESQK